MCKIKICDGRANQNDKYSFFERHIFMFGIYMKKEIEMFCLVFNLKEKRTGDPNLDRHLLSIPIPI